MQTFAQLRPGLLVSTCPEQDFLAFLKLAAHCMGYVRLREEARLAQAGTRASTDSSAAPAPSPFAGISSTAGFDTFHWLHTLWVGVADVAEGGGARQTHREDKRWEVQHAAAPLLKELLLLLDLARVAGSSADAAAARRLERRLYYDDDRQSGLLPVLARLVRGYNYRFQPRAHALELVGLLHVVLRTLDRLERAEGGKRLVRRSAKRSPGGRGWKGKENEGAERGEGAGGDEDASKGEAAGGEKDASKSDGAGGEKDASESSKTRGIEEEVERPAQHSEDDGNDGERGEERSKVRVAKESRWSAAPQTCPCWPLSALPSFPAGVPPLDSPGPRARRRLKLRGAYGQSARVLPLCTFTPGFCLATPPTTPRPTTCSWTFWIAWPAPSA